MSLSSLRKVPALIEEKTFDVSLALRFLKATMFIFYGFLEGILSLEDPADKGLFIIFKAWFYPGKIPSVIVQKTIFQRNT